MSWAASQKASAWDPTKKIWLPSPTLRETVGWSRQRWSSGSARAKIMILKGTGRPRNKSRRGVGDCCTSLWGGVRQWGLSFMHKGNKFLAGSTMMERIFVFLQDFCHSTRTNSTNHNVIFCLIVPNPLKEVVCIFWIHVRNMMDNTMQFIQCIISSGWEVCLNPLIITFRLDQLTKLTQTASRKLEMFIRNKISLDSHQTLVISRIYFRHDHLK